MTRFEGYAALFDRVDRAGDVFRRGAFGAKAAPLLAHHRGSPIGSVAVEEDSHGLRVTGETDAPVRLGDGLSVGYRATRTRQGAWRELLGVELVEVSLVAQPMQPLARVTGVFRQ